MTPVIIPFTRIIWWDLILNPVVLQFNIRGNYYYYYYSKDKIADIANILKCKKKGLGMWEFLFFQAKQRFYIEVLGFMKKILEVKNYL